MAEPVRAWQLTDHDRPATAADRAAGCRTIRRADLPSCAAVFLTNSSGVAPVGRVDDQDIPGNPEITKRLTGLYTSIPWEVI